MADKAKRRWPPLRDDSRRQTFPRARTRRDGQISPDRSTQTRQQDRRGSRKNAEYAIPSRGAPAARKTGEENDRGEHNAVGDGRADNSSNGRDEQRRWRKDQPDAESAALQLFEVGINQRKQLLQEDNRRKREINDENQGPSGARAVKRRPNHRAEGGGQIKQDAAEDDDGVNSCHPAETGCVPVKPADHQARETRQRQCEERKTDKRVCDAAMPGDDQPFIVREHL